MSVDVSASGGKSASQQLTWTHDDLHKVDHVRRACKNIRVSTDAIKYENIVWFLVSERFGSSPIHSKNTQHRNEAESGSDQHGSHLGNTAAHRLVCSVQ